MNYTNSVITLTFGDSAENHVGMEQLGNMVDEGQGYNKDDFEQIIHKFTSLGANVEIYDIAKLSYESKEDEIKPNAYLLVIRNGVNTIFNDLHLDTSVFNDKKMFDEQATLNVDKKVYMYV